MIDKFKEVREAEETNRIIDRLRAQVAAEPGAYDLYTEKPGRRFSDEMLKLLEESRFHTVQPTELGQFELDVHVRVKEKELEITTDEADVSVFLKLLIERGARVEVYSAHDFPDTDEKG